jgi:peptidoglycan-N-acetylglucosamine deacetylase
MIGALAGMIGLAGSAAYFSPWLWRRSRMRGIQKELVKNRVLALTYDDGPSAALTPQLLDLLGNRGARASFFVLGEHAQKDPQIVDRIADEGHDIGCHSQRHLNAWTTLPHAAIADIDGGYECLSRWMKPDGMFRPPYGKMTLPTYRAIRRRGAPVWWWTIDSGDTGGVLPSAGQVVDKLRRDGGGVLLMHDFHRLASRDHFVAALTSELLEVAERESFRIKALSELCR